MTLRFGKFTEEEMIIQSLLYVCLLHMNEEAPSRFARGKKYI
jgi:hypothetical protein